MADTKYFGFVLRSIAKLLIYFVICLAALTLCLRFIPLPWGFLAVPVIVGAVTWFFLAYVEQGKRSFFATGYLLENVVPGGLTGLCAFAVPAAVLLIMGTLRVSGIAPEFDLTDAFYKAFCDQLFAGIVIFGYIFHIIKKDFGMITAMIICPLLYVFFGRTDLSGFVLFTGPQTGLMYMALANVFLTGLCAGAVQLNRGDMRASCAMLLIMGFIENAFPVFFKAEYYDVNVSHADFLYTNIIFTAVLILIAAINIVGSLKNDR